MRAAARRGQQGDDWQVDITLTGAGSEKFDALAHEQYQRQIAIVVDSTVKSAPTVQAQSFGGSAQLTGFDQAGAESLARRINAAAS